MASNHVSYLDPVVLGIAVTPRKLNFMAKQELFSNPVLGCMFMDVGAFPIKRDSVDIWALKEAMRRINNGKALVVFPEGSRRFDHSSVEPQAGVGFLAARLDVPVIPAFIEGTDKALPQGAKFIRPATLSVHFGSPRSFYCKEALDTEKRQDKQIFIERRMPYQEIAQQIMAEIRHLSC